ncbi:Hypothetical predicted protein [Paramuricea clavata]|uniref:Uncharacterized protein n=1 Tax=Paramuricea clavata TaxID=317549 RepID=A0A6S7IVB8_PARCT|nr:Hypothetical predicted protein [Paramuricea clavata]
MESNKTEDIREFLRDFEIFVAVNEWSDVKAGQYLAVFLKGDHAKAFYHQQSDKISVESVLKQISTLEEEQGVTRKVSAAQRTGKLESHVDGAQNIEEVTHQQPSLENKLDEILKNQRTFQAAAVKKGDTGAEVSLICATVPDLEVRESCITPVSITNQPITIQGETDVNLSLGSLETSWKFLVVDNLKESDLGADFIESHYTTSWGISDNKLWLDDVAIPLMGIKNVGMVRDDNHSPVVAKCTVELPAPSNNPMRTKDKSCKSGLFEPTKTPGGVLLSKTAVEGGKDGSFWVRAVNLTSNPVTLLQKSKNRDHFRDRGHGRTTSS